MTLATILLATLAWLGHSGAAPNIFFTAADALHVTAAGAWLGGLVPLALFSPPCVIRRPRSPSRLARTVTRRFSMLGIAMVAVILLTGLINTWNLVGA